MMSQMMSVVRSHIVLRIAIHGSSFPAIAGQSLELRFPRMKDPRPAKGPLPRSISRTVGREK